MEIYSKNLIVNILEAKLLESFIEYNPQGQYNNKFIKYLYKYIRENTYAGEHDILLRQLTNLVNGNKLFKNTTVKEYTDRKTYVLTDDTGFTDEMKNILHKVVKEYYNYKYTLISENRIEVQLKFGWLPPNTASWLNLINDECLIDYYIDGVILRKNTHKYLGGGQPDSGYVCYLVDSVNVYDTVMFLADLAKMGLDKPNITMPKFKVATMLTELRGSKGATLNRIAEFDLDNFFYELGPYNQNYLSATYSALIIQVPWEYAISDYFRLYDVSNSVEINSENNTENPNDIINFFIPFNDPNFDNLFNKFTMKDKDVIIKKLLSSTDVVDTTLIQYILGDFIWKTSDSKLIAYAQNLLNSLFTGSELIADGVWSNTVSNLVTKFKLGSDDVSVFDDDVIDKVTEEAMITQYKLLTNYLDPNEYLFNEW